MGLKRSLTGLTPLNNCFIIAIRISKLSCHIQSLICFHFLLKEKKQPKKCLCSPWLFPWWHGPIKTTVVYRCYNLINRQIKLTNKQKHPRESLEIQKGAWPEASWGYHKVTNIKKNESIFNFRQVYITSLKIFQLWKFFYLNLHQNRMQILFFVMFTNWWISNIQI